MLNLTLHQTETSDWAAFVEESRARLGGGDNPTLMPAHYLHVILPKIGGCGLTVGKDGRTLGYGYLFPRRMEGETRIYTLRYHRLADAPPVVPEELARQVGALLGPDQRAVFYDPTAPHTYPESHETVDGLDLGHPSADEAQAIREMQQAVWESAPELLYPADIHSAEFGLATSLVARSEGRLAGFLYGMAKFGGSPLPRLWEEKLGCRARVESQLMAVLPQFRGRHMAYLLKKSQARQAQAANIDIINWTADPLLYPNAVLNFTRLGAVAYEAHRSLYAFRNALNRVDASRFSLTWLAGSDRVARILSGAQERRTVDLRQQSEILRVNDGPSPLHWDAETPAIAFEIPSDWPRLQRENLTLAQGWRETTDALFAHYLGLEPGRYMVTGAGQDGSRCYLVAEKVTDRLVESLL